MPRHGDAQITRNRGRVFQGNGGAAAVIGVGEPADLLFLQRAHTHGAPARCSRNRNRELALAQDHRSRMIHRGVHGSAVPEVQRAVPQDVVHLEVTPDGACIAIMGEERQLAVVHHAVDPGQVLRFPTRARIVEEALKDRLLQHIILAPVGVHRAAHEGHGAVLVPQPGLAETLPGGVGAGNAGVALHEGVHGVDQSAHVGLAEGWAVRPAVGAAVPGVGPQHGATVEGIRDILGRGVVGHRVEPVHAVPRRKQVVVNHLLVGALGDLVIVRARHEDGVGDPVFPGAPGRLLML